MVGKVSITITGAKELEAALKSLGPKMATRGGDRAIKAGAKIILKEAKRRVPVRTGKLKKSLVARKGEAKIDLRSVVIGFKKPGKRYAHLVEFGTRFAAAKPFLRPALDAEHDNAIKAMVEELSDFILRAEWRKALSLINTGVTLDFGDGD